MRHLTRLLALALTAAAVTTGASACAEEGGATAEARDGSYDLAGMSVTVGSKGSTEGLLLGHITVLALESAGAEVRDEVGPEGSAVVRQALVSGQIDMYWEYTATAWTSFLGQAEPIRDRQEQYEAVAQRDLEQNGIRWLAPADFVNSYALAVNGAAAEELGVATISDFARLANERPDAATICVGNGFSAGGAGLDGLAQHYSFALPEDEVSVVADAAVYSRVNLREPCSFGTVISTDGKVAALDLILLEDDMSYFPTPAPALTVRQEVVEAHPDLEPLAADLAEALDRETMAELNARVDVGGALPASVAERWLREQGFIDGDGQTGQTSSARAPS